MPTPKDYKKVERAEDLKDAFTRRAAEPYLKKGCTVYRGPDSDEGEGKPKKNADFIIVCLNTDCDVFVVLIECKSGTSGVEKAPTQLAEASKAARTAGLIPNAVTDKQLEKCFHVIVFATDKLVRPGKLNNPENKVEIGDKEKPPKLVTDPKNLPLP